MDNIEAAGVTVSIAEPESNEQGGKQRNGHLRSSANVLTMLEVLQERAKHIAETEAGIVDDEWDKLEHHKTPWDKLLEDSASATAANFPGKWDPFSSHVTQPIVFPTLQTPEHQASELREKASSGVEFSWAWAYHSPAGATMTRIIFVIALVAIPCLMYGFLDTDPNCDPGV